MALLAASICLAEIQAVSSAFIPNSPNSKLDPLVATPLRLPLKARRYFTRFGCNINYSFLDSCFLCIQTFTPTTPAVAVLELTFAKSMLDLKVDVGMLPLEAFCFLAISAPPKRPEHIIFTPSAPDLITLSTD